jgi:hypothetical protein
MRTWIWRREGFVGVSGELVGASDNVFIVNYSQAHCLVEFAVILRA